MGTVINAPATVELSCAEAQALGAAGRRDLMRFEAPVPTGWYLTSGVALNHAEAEALSDAGGWITFDDVAKGLWPLTREDKEWHCPHCSVDRRHLMRKCCNEACGGNWGTGCGCCHHQRFWDEGTGEDEPEPEVSLLPEKPDPKTCATCPAFTAEFTSDPLGECRMQAPTVQYGWPKVEQDRWCMLHPLRRAASE